MARFDVYKFDDGVPFVIDIQAGIFSDIGSRVVVPLARVDATRREAMPRLKPHVRVEGEDYVMITTDLVAIPCSMLGDCVCNVEDQRDVIVDAVDFLMQGF